MSVWQMALVLSIVAWVQPTRAIRAQVLSIRERAFVDECLSCQDERLEIIIKELIAQPDALSRHQPGRAVNGAVLGSLGFRRWALATCGSRRWGLTIYWFRYYTTPSCRILGWDHRPHHRDLLRSFIAFLLLSIGLG
jgi:peptide/nickel transport system permease protein